MKLSKSIWIAISVVMLTIAAMASLYLYHRPKPEVPSGPETIRLPLTRSLMYYIGFLPATNHWWMTTNVIPTDPMTVRMVERQLAILAQSLEASRHASPLAEAVASNYSGFFASVYDHGHATVVGTNAASRKDHTNQQEICFFAKSDYRRETFASCMYYDKATRTLMVAGIDWPEPFLSAVLMSELGHAMRYPSPLHYKMKSPEWLAEQLEMHALEADVLNYRTSGKYYAAIERMVDRRMSVKSITNPRDFIESIFLADLKELDVVIGAFDRDRPMRDMSVAQHYITLTSHFIDRKRLPDADKQKSDYYRYVTVGWD